MTFYWWSHWFWITWLSVQLLLPVHVHTYPSQEGRPSTATTKLYQTTSSLSWSTATQSNIMDLTLRPTAAAVAAPQEKVIETLEEQVIEDEAQDDADAEENEAPLAQFEFKRSAEFKAEQLNNYTNFSTSSNSTNTNSSHDSNFTSRSSTTPTASGNGTRPASTTPTSSSAAPLPTSSSTVATPTSKITTTLTPPITSATPSTPKIHTEWLSDELLADGEKAPFTLENANKEDELRRAESEHRSRKSKVLSAEYKHIQRYINFSSDTKSLLTRSASAAPIYEADEGNISSEALAIQRTYFLDAGAISAICFTVFGICCTVGTIGIVLYRRRYLNKPQALSEPDSSVYIDDSTMRDNSDEMYSLDNDSFLNSLEAMTIQNYWTDTVKHTKL